VLFVLLVACSSPLRLPASAASLHERDGRSSSTHDSSSASPSFHLDRDSWITSYGINGIPMKQSLYAGGSGPHVPTATKPADANGVALPRMNRQPRAFFCCMTWIDSVAFIPPRMGAQPEISRTAKTKTNHFITSSSWRSQHGPLCRGFGTWSAEPMNTQVKPVFPNLPNGSPPPGG